MIFNRASSLSKPELLFVSAEKTPLLSSVISNWIPSTLHLIEGHALKTIHDEIHLVVAEALLQGWNCVMIDAANCFNPQIIDSYARNQNISSKKLLEKLLLARPFQAFQLVDLIKQAHNNLAGTSHSVLLLTDPSRLLEDATSDEDAELAFQASGLLQQVCGGDNIVIVITKNKGPMRDNIIPFAKIHVQFELLSSKSWHCELKAHPSTANLQTQYTPKQSPVKSLHQLSLDEFFR